MGEVRVSFIVNKRGISNFDLARHIQRILKEDLLLRADKSDPTLDKFLYVSGIEIKPNE
jgi:hypothetical protein